MPAKSRSGRLQRHATARGMPSTSSATASEVSSRLGAPIWSCGRDIKDKANGMSTDWRPIRWASLPYGPCEYNLSSGDRRCCTAKAARSRSTNEKREYQAANDCSGRNRTMRHTNLAVLAFLWMISLAAHARAGDADDTSDVDDVFVCRLASHDAVAPCSRIIAAGEAKSRFLAFVLAQRARAQFMKGDIDLALSDFSEVLRLSPESAATYFNRALLYHRKGDSGRATADYTAAILLNPTDATAYFNRGAAYEQRGDHEKANEDYGEAFRLDPQVSLAFDIRDAAYDGKCDYERRVLNPVQGPGIDDTGLLLLAYYHRAIAQRENGDLDGAIASYGEAITILPQVDFSFCSRGNLYLAKQDYDRAIADFSEAIRLGYKYSNPGDFKYVAAHINRGQVYLRRGDHDRAIEDFGEAIRLDPTYGNAFIQRGYVQSIKQDYDRAIADYGEAIRLDPRQVRAYIGRGDAYRDKGEYDRAIADYSNAIELDPTDGNAYSGRGEAYRHKGNHDHARADLAAAFQLVPKYASARFPIGRALAHLDEADYGSAVAGYSEAIDVVPNDAPLHFLRGFAHFYNGEMAEAQADFKIAREIDPRQAYFALWLDIAERRNNIPSHLAEATQLDLSRWPGPLVRLFLGEATPTDVFAAADNPSPKKQREQVCEANFYTAQWMLL